MYGNQRKKKKKKKKFIVIILEVGGKKKVEPAFYPLYFISIKTTFSRKTF
jgi:hypothetical protein